MPTQSNLAIDVFSSYFIFINYQEGMFQLRFLALSSFSYYLTQIKKKLLKKSLHISRRGRKAKYIAWLNLLWGEGVCLYPNFK